MSHFKHHIIFGALCLGAVATPAVAGSERLIYDPDSPYFMSDIDQSQADPHSNFVLRGSIGAASIVGQEHVYAGTTGTNNLSLLVWRAQLRSAQSISKSACRMPGRSVVTSMPRYR